ncbi:MAG TPA: hypothetical protein VNH17_08730 [Streptosporangiaceae bacterium]|nr:hypothetical protein [Streptosporangiaceae bacterium]
MTVVLVVRYDTKGEGRAVPIRAVAAAHNQILASPNDGGQFSDTEHHKQEETACEAEKRLAALNALMNTASSLFVEALGYPVVDHRLRLRRAPWLQPAGIDPDQPWPP